MAGAVRVQLRCVTGLRGRGSVQLCHGAAHRKLLQRPAKVLFAGKHACHAIEGLANPDLLIRGDRLFGCFCSVLRSNPNGGRRGAAPGGAAPHLGTACPKAGQTKNACAEKYHASA